MVALLRVRAPWLAVVVSLAGCTQVSDRERFDGESAPLRVLQTVPAPGATDATPTQTVEVCLSRLVDPRSIRPGDTAIASGPARYDTELSLQLFAWRAPGGGPANPQSEAPWCAGSVVSVAPQSALTPGARVRLQMRPTARGWAGEPLDTDQAGWIVPAGGGEPRFYLEFTVDPNATSPIGGAMEGGGALPGGDDDNDDTPTLRSLFEEGGPLDPARGQCSCHRDPTRLAWRRLDLTDADVAFDGLVAASGPRDNGFAMVAPRDPSQSFLLHKLVRNETGGPIHGVLGGAMPPDGPLPYQDMVAIAEWIQAGARP